MPNVICGCGKSVETKPEWAGQWIACPGCGGTLYAPFPGDKPASPPPLMAIVEGPLPVAAPTTKLCPWCAETIPSSSTACPFCKGDSNAQPAARPAPAIPAPAPAPSSDSGGMAPLIIGILGFMFCQLASPVAWAMGSSYEKNCRARGVAPSSAGHAGKILGIVGTVFLFLILGFMVISMLISPTTS